MENHFELGEDFLDEYPNIDDTQIEEPDDIFGEQPKDNTEPEPTKQDEPNPLQTVTIDPDEDVIVSFLKTKGIADPSKIQFRNETGDIEEVDFNSLSREEQLDLLENMSETQNLTDDEIQTVQYLRDNNLTLKDFAAYIQNKTIEAYQRNQTVVNSVDQLTDEELFVLHLKSQYPELSREELAKELEIATDDEDLFKKKVSKLRTDYINLEKQQKEAEEKQATEQREAQYKQLVDTMVQVAKDRDDFYGLELDDDDKEEVLDFLLTKDVNGNSQFSKVLNDPRELFELAFFALKGQEAFQTLHSYYKKEIDKANGKGQFSQPGKKVVIKPKSGKGEDPYGIWS